VDLDSFTSGRPMHDHLLLHQSHSSSAHSLFFSFRSLLRGGPARGGPRYGVLSGGESCGGNSGSKLQRGREALSERRRRRSRSHQGAATTRATVRRSMRRRRPGTGGRRARVRQILAAQFCCSDFPPLYLFLSYFCSQFFL
jgi:hypothetical protein